MITNNTLFTGDNLYVMHGMNSESVDLIYLDPPFNSKRMYKAPVGSKAAGTSFKDMWTWEDVDLSYLEGIVDDYPYLVQFIQSIEVIHGKPMMSYITYMAQRIVEMHRILKSTGSIYLHCDPTASHYLKIVLDRIFGKENFRNEIVWYYKNASRGKSKYANSHDVIFWVSKSQKYIFNRNEILQEFDSGMTAWRYKKGGQAGKPMPKGKTPDDVITLPSLNAMAKERTGYPTQKPLALLNRIIKASTEGGGGQCCVRSVLWMRNYSGCGSAVRSEVDRYRYKRKICRAGSGKII